ncbi:cdc42 effector protein 4a [Alosa pseudoharengus]|uniref:cdc42 effector protein 4a n=1 Tax=Alosa pseudoharengus TaxID=34774 RepID=UPI003F8A468F
MPILKQLVAGSSQTKRRTRTELTTEMISAPLGDFRHTMHVGRSGEAFGDTSFLSSRSGEPPREAPATAFPRSPKPGLLTRTFRSSKRSQSVNRVDQRGDNTLLPPGGSPTLVKNALSLPFLNDESDGEGGGGRALQSLTSSPLRQAPGPDSRASSNGALAAPQVLDLEQHEQLFGVLTDLRSPGSYNGGGGGMKKAESVMSFHVDLGPSMMGDVLFVMEKEEDDLGFEEGKSSEGRASPPLSVHAEGDEEVDEEQHNYDEDHRKEEEEGHEEEHGEEEEEEEVGEEKDVKVEVIEAQIEAHPGVPEHQQQQQQRYELEEPEDVHEDVHNLHDQVPPRPPSSVDQDIQMDAPYTPELQPKHLKNTDSCSMSSSSSAAFDERPPSQLLEVEAPGVTRYSPPPPVEEGEFSSFIEDEDDEIRL